MGTTHHFMGATEHFMVATLCVMGAIRPLMGSMVICRLTYQYLDLYYLQFVDKNNFYFWLPYHTVKIGDTWNKGDTAYARRVHTTFIRAHTVLLPIDLLQYSLASSYVVFIPNILYNLLLMSFSISGVLKGGAKKTNSF